MVLDLQIPIFEVEKSKIETRVSIGKINPPSSQTDIKIDLRMNFNLDQQSSSSSSEGTPHNENVTSFNIESKLQTPTIDKTQMNKDFQISIFDTENSQTDLGIDKNLDFSSSSNETLKKGGIFSTGNKQIDMLKIEKNR
jgi:hypothetical protein